MTAKNQFEVVRTTTVAAPPDAVYPLIADFHRWTIWSPWEELDPNLERTYAGAEAGVGAAYSWRGNRKAGQGRMEITAADEPRRIEIALDFERPFKSSNTTTFELRPVGDGTEVTWRMVGPVTLMGRIFGIFMSMDKMVGRDFEKGLAQLGAAVAAN
jgi:uncharacterized protein YndB with AHSA1/START domain